MPELPPARVRLACVKHAASVQSEPGSNSSVEKLDLYTSNSIDVGPIPSPALTALNRTRLFASCEHFGSVDHPNNPPATRLAPCRQAVSRHPKPERPHLS